MLSSIHPLGEQGRGFSYRGTAASFVIGSTAGGLATGALVGALGWLIRASGTLGSDPSVPLAFLAVVAVVALGVEVSNRSIPALGRQVNEDWLNEYRNWVYGSGFGFQLGAGVLTYITSSAVVLWLAAVLVAPSLAASLVIGGAFGFVRGLGILTVWRVRSPRDLVRFHSSLHRRAALVWRIGSVLLGAVGLVAGAAAVAGWTA